ncbi:MAG: hypothetical protein EOO09_16770 [Chitinophagaceae bacterium]|nr:MAG: hypothetical protein EOO09_16770 [Chitinophagaceae bacterium]
MSATRRLVSGSLAAWGKIVVTVFSQLLLVPVYLGHWSVETYGIWISIQAFISVATTLDKGHQDYLGFEFLKIGKEKLPEIRKVLWNGVLVTLSLGILQVLVIAGLAFSSGVLSELWTDKASDLQLVRDAGIVLVLSAINWLINQNILGVFIRVLSPFGYYPRMSWWGVLYSIISSFAPVIAVMFGASLLQAGIVLTLSTVVYSLLQLADIMRLLKKEQLFGADYDRKTAFVNLGRSLGVSARGLLENVRQQGIRLILAPLSGLRELTVFSTLRTGANFALQGLSSITNPLMPELMRFLNQKDQDRFESALSSIWIVVVVLLVPAIIVVQAFAEPLFQVWTRGKIEFNPLLFALLSVNVLLYALTQPALAIITGNNLLKIQLSVSITTAVILIGSMAVLVPRIGLSGAGFALCLAEAASAALYRYHAVKWLRRHGMAWPTRNYNIVLLSVLVSAAIMFVMIRFPAQRSLILLLSIPVLALVIYSYWKTLPAIAVSKLKVGKFSPGFLRNRLLKKSA